MFRTRLISGVILVLLALVTIIAGGPVLTLTLLLVSLIGLYELYRVLRVWEPAAPLLGLTGFAGTILLYFLLLLHLEEYLLLALIGTMIAMMFVYVFTYPYYQAEKVLSALAGVVYVSVMLSFVLQTRNLTNGVYLVWLIFLCSWGCDTCAYCVGKLLGKHKMSPRLSPKKSVEGAIGGVAGAAILGAVYAAAIGKHLQSSGNEIVIFAVICAIGGLISMVGDLTASAIKRNHNIKDYGNLIPGHGGILDRFDSVIITAPVIYFLAAVMMK